MRNVQSRLLFGAVMFFIRVYNYLLQKTCVFHPSEKLAAVLKSPEPVIIAILHQDSLSTYPFLLKHAPDKHFCSLTSLSKDGELAAYLMENMGVKAVRGSSSREGFKGFLEMSRLIREEEYSVIFPCDGPRRPYGKVQPGAAMLSAITGVPVYILRTRARHQLILEKTPPKIFLPRPFSEIVALETGPIHIKRRCTKEAAAQHQARLQRGFDELIRQADSYFKS
jgi:lysophospholipid acyltransferase (LPLAT)-like uncharacterized protein